MKVCECGAHEILYRRSRGGEVIHRATCTRQGERGHDWHYAATVCGNDHQRVLDVIAEVSWLKACAYCMSPALVVKRATP
jgi:hypothetical protein